MNTLWEALLGLGGLSVRIMSEQARRLRNSMLILIFVFYAMAFLQLFFRGHGAVNIIGLILFLGAIFHYFRIGNIARETGLGEFLELIHITPGNQNDDAPGIVLNQLSVTLFVFREKMLFFTAIICMIVPSFPVWNNPWIIGAITIAGTTILVLIWRSGETWIRPITWLVVVSYLSINLLLCFPSIQARISWINGPLNFFPNETTAEIINASEEKIKEARIKLVNTDMQLVLNKQIADPLYVPTAAEKKFLNQARKGGLKTLKEVASEESPAPAPDSNPAESGKKIGRKLVAIGKRHLNEFPNTISSPEGMALALKPGRYEQEPSGETQYAFPGTKGVQTIGDGKRFTIPEGKNVDGIFTSHKEVRIYRLD